MILSKGFFARASQTSIQNQSVVKITWLFDLRESCNACRSQENCIETFNWLEEVGAEYQLKWVQSFHIYWFLEIATDHWWQLYVLDGVGGAGVDGGRVVTEIQKKRRQIEPTLEKLIIEFIHLMVIA